MKAVDISIKNRIAVIVLAIILVIGGAVAYVTIPKESSPDIDIPIYVVTTIYPGIGPTDMESLVTQPIERELQGIEGVDEITSTTQESLSMIVVEFDLDVDRIEASQEVREQVDLARPEIPDDVEEPIITEIDLDDFPVLTVNLSADYDLSRLTDLADDLEDELETLGGVREVDVVGGVEREIQVNVDLERYLSYGTSFEQMIGAIQAENLTVPGGTVDVDFMEYLLRISGEFDDPSEIEDLVVHTPVDPETGERSPPVYMRDLADVVFGFADRESYSTLKAFQTEDNEGTIERIPMEEAEMNEVVSLDIIQRSGANVLETTDEVKELLAEYHLPAGTQVTMTGDQSENVRDLISDLENSIISGMLFVVLVLVFFLGLRNALLVGTAVPLAILVGFIILTLSGFTVNFIILFSLIVALGLLVDNSVVVVENIYRYREMGYERFDAARRATSEVGYALIAATATLVAAFAPLLLWPGIIGQFMSYLPITLIIVLASSLFIALIIYPVLTGIVVRLESEEPKPVGIWAKRFAYGIIALTALIIGFANPISLASFGLVVLFFVITYKYIVKPISGWFTTIALPAVIERYKNFLRWMLERDYSVRYAFWRNAFSMISFTTGVLLLVLGGLVYGLAEASGLVLLIPGGILLALGVIGIIIHTLEAIFVGGSRSVIGGLAFGLVIGFILGIVYLAGRDITGNEIIGIMMFPAAVVVIGLLGMLRGKRQSLIITDNRSRLVNIAFGSLFAIIGMFMVAPTGVTFFPDVDPNQIRVEIEGPIGMNLEATDRVTRDIQDELDQMMVDYPEAYEGVENILLNSGVTLGMAGPPNPNESRITMNMVDYGDRTEPSGVTLNRIRELLQDIPDIFIQVDQEDIGPPTGLPVEIEISGPDFDQIVNITEDIRDDLLTAVEEDQIQGLTDLRDNVTGGIPEYEILIDSERANQYGLTLSDVAQTVSVAYEGVEASQWRDGEDEYEIRVRLEEEDRMSLESLKNMAVNTGQSQIPLVSVADFEEREGLGVITRVDLARTATIEGDAALGFSGPEVLGQVQEYLADYELPPGYEIEYVGEAEDQEEAFEFLSVALAMSFALIFLIILTKFNNINVPFIIVTAVGLSLIGVLLGLTLSRTMFGSMPFVGVISLAGIVCINNIVLVDYVQQMLKSGKTKKDAIVEAGAIRLRPVLLTATTTILGLVPLTFGINIDFVGFLTEFDPDFQLGTENTEFWGPMGITIISGLIFATFLTLVIVPVIYSVMDSFAVKLRKVWRGE